MLLGWSDLRNLYWFTDWIIIPNTELPSIIHAPSIYVASTGNGERKLLTHFDISDNWDISIHANFRIRFSSA